MAKGKTLPEMQAVATQRAEAIVGAWTKKPSGKTKLIIDEYRQAYKEIAELLKDTHAKYLSAIKPEEFRAVMAQYDRLKKLQKSINEIYRQHASKAGRIQAETGRIAMTNKYYDDMFSMNQFTKTLGKEYFVYIDQKAVEVSVLGTPKIWDDLTKEAQAQLYPYQPKHGTLINTLLNNRTKDLIKIKQSVTQGIIQGTSWQKTAQQIQHTMETSASNALRIARTEGARNMNSGEYADTMAAFESGVEMKRRYVATLDDRTRQQSSSMDGQEIDPDGSFLYPNGVRAEVVGASGVPEYDINDRCTSINIIEGLEPEMRTAKLPGESRSTPISYRNHGDWMKDNGLRFNKSGKMVPTNTV